jgi:hypothetical protein
MATGERTRDCRWIVLLSTILPSANRVHKKSDNRDSVNYTHLPIQMISLSPLPSYAHGGDHRKNGLVFPWV